MIRYQKKILCTFCHNLTIKIPKNICFTFAYTLCFLKIKTIAESPRHPSLSTKLHLCETSFGWLIYVTEWNNLFDYAAIFSEICRGPFYYTEIYLWNINVIIFACILLSKKFQSCWYFKLSRNSNPEKSGNSH